LAAVRSTATTEAGRPFKFVAVPGTSAAEHRRYAEHYARASFGTIRAFPPAGPRGGGRIRVGYLSADLWDHAVGYVMEGAWEGQDRERFHFTAYSLAPRRATPMCERVCALFDEVVFLNGKSDLEAARRIRDDGVEILIDLMGYTGESRAEILAFHPARVQVAYLGYPGTTGAPHMDCLIADSFIIPAELETHYSERVMRLMQGYMPWPRARALPPARREDHGLPPSAVVLCCFNNSYKITPAIFDAWCRILREVPDAVLWLALDGDVVERNLRREAAERGVESARLIRAPKLVEHAQHLARIQCADLFLDTTPFNAHSTCIDALSAGVPVLTCVGETFPSRVAGSLLAAIGMPELIATSLETYCETAIRLASDRANLRRARDRVATQMARHRQLDSGAFSRDLEKLFLNLVGSA
jgi:predicted O-linked N-acetylglucosamine transferase (SPINDLY family)